MRWRRSRPWKIRVATKMSTAAKVASGTSVRRPAAGISATMTRAAPSPAAWVRPPADDTAAVRAGLALTAKDPTRPDTMLPAPTPMKSRPTSAVAAPGGGEGAGGGGGLAHDHQGHDGGHGKNVAERRPRQLGQAQVRGGVGHGAQSGDAPVVKVGDGHHDGRADETEAARRGCAG